MSVASQFLQLLRGSVPAPGGPADEVRLYAAADGSLWTILADGTNAQVGGGGGGSQPYVLARNGLVADLDTGGASVVLLDPSPQNWEAGKTYSLETYTGSTVQSIVHPSDDPSRFFQPCYTAAPVSGSEEPAWAEGSVDDNEILWNGDPYAAWQADHVYDGNLLVVESGHIFQGTGTSGGSKPNFASASSYGDTVSDNTVTWENVGSVSTWQPSHAYSWFIATVGPSAGYAVSNFVIPTTPNGLAFALSSTLPPWVVATGDEPDWSTVPDGSGQQVIGSGMVWEETTNTPSLKLTGLVASGDPALITIANTALPDSQATVVLLDDAIVSGNFSPLVRSSDGNRFNGNNNDVTLAASGADSGQALPLPVLYANGQWQPPVTDF